MKSIPYKLAYLYWFIPLFFLALTIHQLAVYQGIQTTYQEGTSYTAEVLEFDTKQIVTQNSSYAVLQFDTREGKTIRRKLSLPVEISGKVSESRIIPVRYHPDSFQEIIIIAAYDAHTSMTLANIAMAAFALLATSILGWGITRWIRTKTNRDSPNNLIIENINTPRL
jgi:hypothetical protein